MLMLPVWTMAQEESIYDDHKRFRIVSVILNTESNCIEMVKEKGYSFDYRNIILEYVIYEPSSERWKEVYSVVDGKIKLIETIKAIYHPEMTLPERWEFPKAIREVDRKLKGKNK